jgi:hypothetical protein
MISEDLVKRDYSSGLAKDPSIMAAKNDDLCDQSRGLSDFFKKDDFTPFSRSGSGDYLQGIKNEIVGAGN